ncbi:MAG: endospore germination permease [Clostridiaceae bacterium]|nr:endospore germination permease [Clostridiaceae bacterium]
MINESISDKQGICLMVLFIFGSTLIVGIGGEAKQNSWISVILGVILALPAVMVYARLLSLYPRKDLFDILMELFGSLLGRILSLVYIWFAFHLGTLVLRNYLEFTSNVVFPDTPAWLLPLFLVPLISWVTKGGIEVLGRCAEFLILFIIGLIILITISLSMPRIEIKNILPIMYDGFRPVFMSAFAAFSFPFAETIIFTMCFSSLKTTRSPYKAYILGLIIGGFFLLIATLRNILILGAGAIAENYFPSNVAVSVIHLGDLLQRLELSVSAVLIICVFIKLSVCILGVCNGVSKIFKLKDFKFLATPICAMLFTFSLFIYSSTMEMNEFAFKVWPYYAFLFQAILPALIIIVAEIKNWKSNKNLKNIST